MPLPRTAMATLSLPHPTSQFPSIFTIILPSPVSVSLGAHIILGDINTLLTFATLLGHDVVQFPEHQTLMV